MELHILQMCMLLEAYSDGGVLIGLPRAKAIQIAAMTMMVCEYVLSKGVLVTSIDPTINFNAYFSVKSMPFRLAVPWSHETCETN